MRDIIEGLRRADPTAIEQLVALFGGKIYRLAYGITRNAADAEEVVQDVLLTVTRRISTFEGGSALWTWMYRITTNAALNKRRGKRYQVEVSLDDDLPAWKADGHRDGDRAFLLADWSQRPDEALLSKEGRELIEAALARLPDDYRAVLVLRDVEGLSNEEAAEVVGGSVSSVKSRLHRARMALREHLTRGQTLPSEVQA